MFETAVVASAPAGRRAWSTCIGFTCQAILVGFAILIPILFPDSMPSPQTWLKVFLPLSPPPPPPAAAPVQTFARAAIAHPFDDHQLHAPAAIPERVAMIVDPAPVTGAAIGVPGGVPGGQEGGVPGGILNSVLESGRATVAPPVPVATTPKPAETAPAVIQRVRMGGQVKMAVPIHRVEPVYSPLARQMRVSGTVQITGVIGIDGRMKELKVVSGHPLLVNAALEAVRQWIYAPTTLNGEPVEVVAPITVTFVLN